MLLNVQVIMQIYLHFKGVFINELMNELFEWNEFLIKDESSIRSAASLFYFPGWHEDLFENILMCERDVI